MGARFSLDGGMIPRSVKRMFDQRAEARVEAASMTAVLTYRGRRHVVRLANVSASGAMVIFPQIPHIGEEIRLDLVDRGAVPAIVRWVRDGRIGVNFAAAGE